ncbi:MAG TPA: hypothetical protein VMD09_08905 [Solirubrobacteraceae bacterium]|nr:hypothetical protein [Solirubrobacteraceae bacterium]
MSMSASTRNEDGLDGIELWTIRGLIAEHRMAALVAAALCALLVGTLALVALGGKAGPLNDATTCTQWGNANQNRQTAYARLYVTEHGSVPKYGGTPAAVINAINFGCGVAYGDDVADTATVVQAIDGTF